MSAWLLADLNFSSMAALIESSRLDILFICEVTPLLMEFSRLENFASRASISFLWIRAVSFAELFKSWNLDSIVFCRSFSYLIMTICLVFMLLM